MKKYVFLLLCIGLLTNCKRDITGGTLAVPAASLRNLDIDPDATYRIATDLEIIQMDVPVWGGCRKSSSPRSSVDNLDNAIAQTEVACDLFLGFYVLYKGAMLTTDGKNNQQVLPVTFLSPRLLNQTDLIPTKGSMMLVEVNPCNVRVDKYLVPHAFVVSK